MATSTAEALLDEAIAQFAAKERERVALSNVAAGSRQQGHGAPLVLPLSLASTPEDDEIFRIVSKKKMMHTSNAASSSIDAAVLRYARPYEVGHSVAGPGGRWRENEVMMLSLPATLQTQSATFGSDGDASDPARVRSLSLEPGTCGRYKLYRSGKAELTVHGLPMELTTGIPRQHVEQLVATMLNMPVPITLSSDQPTSGDFVPLGKIQSHLVAEVALEVLLGSAGAPGEAKQRLVDEYLALPRHRTKS